MAIGQQVLRGTLDVPGLLAVEDRIERRAVDAGRTHAGLLRDVLDLHTRHAVAGMPLSTVPQVALLLRCSEWRAGRLLTEALGMAELPEGIESLEWGLLTPEQSWVVVTQLAPLTPGTRLAVWQRLLDRLPSGGLPPARLTELLKRWVVAADSEAAEQRRRAAEDERRVAYRRRDDGLVDLFAMGFRGPIAQAILSRIQERSAPFGSLDERSADQRRFDALQDMLLGRDPQGQCGCPAGDVAPCGADVQVLIPLGAALGVTDEIAEVVGHGPIEPDLVQGLLGNAPRLTPVYVDADGVPVAIGRAVRVPSRAGPAEVREVLLRLAAGPPPDGLHPRHPHDHAKPPPGDGRSPDRRHDATPPPRLVLPALSGPAAAAAHPTDRPGQYRVPGRLRRLLFARAPRCEFPGCGARAVRCDVEHDRAWPDGPSCACNLGPCCRRHHRVKQEGWTKTRTADGVIWTTRSGRQHVSPHQHEAPAPVVRDLPRLPKTPHPFDELSPLELEHQLWWLAECPDDPAGLELRALDSEPEDDEDALSGDTTWGLLLRDPYAWLEPEQLPPVEPQSSAM